MTTKDKSVLRSIYQKKIQDYFLDKSSLKEKKIDLDKREKESLKIVENLHRFSFAKEYQIGAYQALPEEPCLDSFFKDRSIGFPIVSGEEMSFYIPLNTQDFKKNKFSILEPKPEKSQKILPKDIDVLLIPGCVFDRQGGRIGRGRAYYDRFLSQTSALKIGIAWSFQLHSSLLKLESHDVPMDFIVTEKFISIPSFSKNKGFQQLSSQRFNKKQSSSAREVSSYKEF